MNDNETLDILETEFGFDDIREVYNNFGNSYFLDYIVIDSYVLKRLLCTAYNTELKFIELLYDNGRIDENNINKRNKVLINFLRENIDMVNMWRL